MAVDKLALMGIWLDRGVVYGSACMEKCIKIKPRGPRARSLDLDDPGH
jgi:hypothetical protein